MASAPQPAPSPLRVLLVGKKDEDFFLIREMLERNRGALPSELDHATSLDEARTMLEGSPYCLVLFEHDTADSAALKLLSDLLESGRATPFILLTEHADEKAVAEIIQAGAYDCMERSHLDGANLVRTMRCALNLHSSQVQTRTAEQSLRKLSCAVEQSADAIMITDGNGMIEYANPGFEALTGYSLEEVTGKKPSLLNSGQQAPSFYRDLWRTLLAGETYRNVLVNRKKNGELYYVDESISPIRDSHGRITHFISNGRDLTGRMRVEAQLIQAQKMDAVGRLAGGVAHDFNNLLTIITSYSELALDAIPAEGSAHARVQEILGAARRAAELTRQLLAFSRQQPQALRVAELNPVVAGMVKMLHRLIGEDIELNFIPGNGVGRIRLDPLQIEQILMNLAANSRDAMPEGGRITIETSDVRLDEKYADRKRAAIPLGRYAVLTISDTGTGIPAEDLPHIFEPFYTTKPSGKGTGLGLATVYGIVKQNHGFIWAYSEAGMGTTFKLYFPCVSDQRPGTPAEVAAPVTIGRGNETILLVEDEDAVRAAAAEFLTLNGYHVLQAKDGVDALAVLKRQTSKVHIAVTDVVMPRMSGGELAKAIESLCPETLVLFVSGYAGQTVLDHKVVNVESNFLQKPFTLKQLAGKIRAVLDRTSLSAPVTAAQSASTFHFSDESDPRAT